MQMAPPLIPNKQIKLVKSLVLNSKIWQILKQS